MGGRLEPPAALVAEDKVAPAHQTRTKQAAGVPEGPCERHAGLEAEVEAEAEAEAEAKVDVDVDAEVDADADADADAEGGGRSRG